MTDTYMIAGFVILGVLMPLVTFALNLYWQNRSAKRQDENEIRKDVARETTVDIKLDNITRTLTSIDMKIENMQETINKLERKNSVTEEKLVEHERRFSELEKKIQDAEEHIKVVRQNLEKLHQDYRERVAHCHVKENHQ